MRMNSIKPPAVAIEYDRHGERVRKHFEDPWQAKRFYVAKLKAGKQPTVTGKLPAAKQS